MIASASAQFPLSTIVTKSNNGRVVVTANLIELAVEICGIDREPARRAESGTYLVNNPRTDAQNPEFHAGVIDSANHDSHLTVRVQEGLSG